VGSAQPREPQPSLDSLVAQARQLSNEINALSEQYDGLRIQFTEARTEARIARETAARDAAALRAGETQIAQIAAQNYMGGGYDPTLELITNANPQAFIERASIMNQLEQQNGDKIGTLEAAQAVAQRASETARQQAARVSGLQAQMSVKTQAIQGKINQINSATFKQAMVVFQQTGQYPTINIPTANTVGAQALQYALTKQGAPYVWGASGPDAFDCSGLVLWAYAQVGISLPHYTGNQWVSGEHVSRDQLQPGDLVFFFADISHVGLYIGNGLMIDAPDFGVPVHVEPVYWGAYIGAVRIVA
jgi:cell wall-associated NlpC family hydrolase